ncbi:MAG: hypothetical protein HFE63_09435 [Clostridiales bacterium]|nr:hypothetical protein [Clostridiales bacterium]
MKYILLGEPAFQIYADELSQRGFKPVSLSPDTRLNRIVQTHADTLVFEYGGHLIMNRGYLTQLDLPTQLAARVEPTEDYPHGNYPDDVRFNALVIGRNMYAKRSALSPALISLANENQLNIVNVRQGYARCSVLALPSANAAVTADSGLADALEANGVRVLRISAGGIRLDGCEYGFIGGASFVDDPQCCCSLHSRPTVYFYGSLGIHPDGERIRQFIEGCGYNVITLMQSESLCDFGGGIVIYC